MSDAVENFVIGLTGSVGSGCTTLSKILVEDRFKRISIPELIKQKFKELHKGEEPNLESFGKDWRAELQEIGNSGRNGEFVTNRKTDKDYRDYWVDLALKDVTDKSVVIDGIRNIGEVESLRNRFPNFWLVAVYADFNTRWERVEKKGSYSEKPVFQRDDLIDSNEDDPIGQSVQRCVYEADYVLKNVKKLTPKESRKEILTRKLLEQISVMKGETTNPKKPEVSMATAVSQSHASRCLKRKVGALIVDETNGIPLSVGYNENPVGMEPCFLLYNGCYKDMIMETKLEDMSPLFCPECGTQHQSISKPWKCNGTKTDGNPCRCNFKLKFFPSRNMELCTAIHAEERAIRSLGQRSADGCTIYVNTFPCFQCCRYIKDAGITKIVYVESYPVTEAVDFLRENKIDFEPFEGFTPRAFNRVFKQVE